MAFCNIKDSTGHPENIFLHDFQDASPTRMFVREALSLPFCRNHNDDVNNSDDDFHSFHLVRIMGHVLSVQPGKENDHYHGCFDSDDNEGENSNQREAHCRTWSLLLDDGTGIIKVEKYIQHPFVMFQTDIRVTEPYGLYQDYPKQGQLIDCIGCLGYIESDEEEDNISQKLELSQLYFQRYTQTQISPREYMLQTRPTDKVTLIQQSPPNVNEAIKRKIDFDDTVDDISVKQEEVTIDINEQDHEKNENNNDGDDHDCITDQTGIIAENMESPSKKQKTNDIMLEMKEKSPGKNTDCNENHLDNDDNIVDNSIDENHVKQKEGTLNSTGQDTKQEKTQRIDYIATENKMGSFEKQKTDETDNHDGCDSDNDYKSLLKQKGECFYSNEQYDKNNYKNDEINQVDINAKSRGHAPNIQKIDDTNQSKNQITENDCDGDIGTNNDSAGEEHHIDMIKHKTYPRHVDDDYGEAEKYSIPTHNSIDRLNQTDQHSQDIMSSEDVTDLKEEKPSHATKSPRIYLHFYSPVDDINQFTLRMLEIYTLQKQYQPMDIDQCASSISSPLRPNQNMSHEHISPLLSPSSLLPSMLSPPPLQPSPLPLQIPLPLVSHLPMGPLSQNFGTFYPNEQNELSFSKYHLFRLIQQTKGHGGITVEELAVALNGSEDMLYDALRELENCGKIFQSDSGQYISLS